MKLSILFFVILFSVAACAFPTKRTKTLESESVEKTSTPSMRIDAPEIIDRANESGCDIEKVELEVSKRRDRIIIDCRKLEKE